MVLVQGQEFYPARHWRRGASAHTIGNQLTEFTMPNTTIKILNMQSDECLRLVMNAIQDLPCIGHVDISMNTGEATIEHTTVVSESDIRQIIEDAGYPTA